MIDERFARALHVQTLKHAQLAPEHEPHVLFQASTIGALLEGAYDGDVSFAELAEHGDLGLGTLQRTRRRDGRPRWALPSRGRRRSGHGDRSGGADPVRRRRAVRPDDRAVTRCARPVRSAGRTRPGAAGGLRRLRPARRRRVRARPRPLRAPPASALPPAHRRRRRPARVRAAGRARHPRRLPFPEYSGTIEISGYHLHFVSDDRRRGGHVLDCRTRAVTAWLDPSTDLHVELAPGVDLTEAHLHRTAAEAVKRVEHEG